METKKASKLPWGHVICCFVLLIIFLLTVGIHINAEGYSESENEIAEESEVIPLQSSASGRLTLDKFESYEENSVEFSGPVEEVTVEYDAFNSYLSTYAKELELFSKTFGVSYDDILEDINERHNANIDKEFEKTNIGYLQNSNGEIKQYDTVEYGIVEYFYDYVEKHPKNVSNKRKPYTGNAEYVENLIIYYTSHIYTNVDTSVALSIGAAESGYYKSKGMLSANNVYGGMSSSHSLLKYKNIEYGVLSYIRILSKNYYGKGLDTIAKIGKKYNPRYDDNGNKIASPHWVSLVNKAMKYYSSYNLEIEIDNLL